jgi:hypothetical protein
VNPEGEVRHDRFQREECSAHAFLQQDETDESKQYWNKYKRKRGQDDKTFLNYVLIDRERHEGKKQQKHKPLASPSQYVSNAPLAATRHIPSQGLLNAFIAGSLADTCQRGRQVFVVFEWIVELGPCRREISVLSVRSTF